MTDAGGDLARFACEMSKSAPVVRDRKSLPEKKDEVFRRDRAAGTIVGTPASLTLRNSLVGLGVLGLCLQSSNPKVVGSNPTECWKTERAIGSASIG